MSRETTLKTYLSEVNEHYDYILIDCTLARGMIGLLQTITRVKKHINPSLKVDGILLTLVDNRTNLAKSTVAKAYSEFTKEVITNR